MGYLEDCALCSRLFGLDSDSSCRNLRLDFDTLTQQRLSHFVTRITISLVRICRAWTASCQSDHPVVLYVVRLSTSSPCSLQSHANKTYPSNSKRHAWSHPDAHHLFSFLAINSFKIFTRLSNASNHSPSSFCTLA